MAISTTTVFEVEWTADGLGGDRMVEVPRDLPLTKDFDEDELETDWRRIGDISHWGIFDVVTDEHRVGGAVAFPESLGVHILEGREDVPVLWAIRAHPSARRSGVGMCLLDRAVEFVPRLPVRFASSSPTTPTPPPAASTPSSAFTSADCAAASTREHG